MASEKIEAIVAEVEKLTVLELSELVSAVEEKFGVTAAAAVVAAGPVAGAAAAADPGPGRHLVGHRGFGRCGAGTYGFLLYKVQKQISLPIQYPKRLCPSSGKDAMSCNNSCQNFNHGI